MQGTVMTGSALRPTALVADPHKDTVDRRIPETYTLFQSREVYAPWAVLFTEIDNAQNPSDDLLNLRAALLASFSRCKQNTKLAEFAVSMQKWEQRAFTSMKERAETQIIECYNSLMNLLESQPTKQSIPWQSRLLASAHFMIHAADPHTIRQGRRLSSGVTCVIHRVFSLCPASAAKMIVAACIDGKWTAFDGQIIALSQSSLQPKMEELSYNSRSDKRSYACQILQLLLLNNCLQRRLTPLTYEESSGRPGREYLGQRPAQQTNLSHGEIELLSRYEFGHKGAVVAHSLSFSYVSAQNESSYIQNMLVHVSSLADLAEVLGEAKSKNKLPLSVAVDERKLLSEAYCDGINHVINVTDFDGINSVLVYNPRLLPGMKSHCRISLQKLYNACVNVS
jgi:hypothetical protein